MTRTGHKGFHCVPGCPVEAALQHIGGKWKGVILYHLVMDGILRFGEIKRRLPNVTPRMLTNQLRELEASKLIERHIYAEVPPRVEYSLSPVGLSFEPILLSLLNWGRENYPPIEKPANENGI